ncbi:Mov34/MPN/PAD-1 family protein [Cohnella hongkongensis]|uniref:Mov34/MPN/PAD-1 family protein n=1 Tax=Cohnella hongkongensis TaxID=178337 RepID=A0ABV9FDP4_9BACL
METSREARLDADVEKKLVSALLNRLPNESCGLLWGTAANGVIEVGGFRLIRNAADSPAAQFRFDAEDWIAAYYEAQKNQREIVGLFHSHPSGTIVPSESDLAGFVPWKSYWIVGLQSAGHQIGVYVRQSEAGWAKLPLRVVSGGSSMRTAHPASSLADPKSV